MRPAYFDQYPTLAFERDDRGVLTLRLHSNGGEAIYASQHHTDWCGAFYDIGRDRANKVMILTGTGETFMAKWGWDYQTRSAEDWDKIAYEAKRMLRNLLDIEIPIIAAVNGPATIHAEIAVLSDIVLAAEHATFQDKPHYIRQVVPGDGVHVVWQELLGVNRARYFLLTGQVLSAADALALGVVAEVLPAAALMQRAEALADQLLKAPPLTMRYARAVLTQRLKRALDADLPLGLALEGLAVLNMVHPPAVPAGRS